MSPVNAGYKLTSQVRTPVWHIIMLGSTKL